MALRYVAFVNEMEKPFERVEEAEAFLEAEAAKHLVVLDRVVPLIAALVRKKVAKGKLLSEALNKVVGSERDETEWNGFVEVRFL